MLTNEPVVDPELARWLTGQISWISFVLTSAATAPAKSDCDISHAIDELDRLLGRIRRRTGANGMSAEEVPCIVDSMVGIHTRLYDCWTAALIPPVDRHRADRLSAACRLVRGVLISLQPGALPATTRVAIRDPQ